ILNVPAPLRLALVVAGSLVAMVLLVYGIDRVSNGGEVLGSVTVDGVGSGGLDENAALARVRGLEESLASRPVPAVVAGHRFDLDPRQIGFDLDEQAILDEALHNGRTGNVFRQFGSWLTRFGSGSRDIAVSYDYDPAALASIVAGWEAEGIADPPFPGDVTVEDGAIVYQYP